MSVARQRNRRFLRIMATRRRDSSASSWCSTPGRYPPQDGAHIAHGAALLAAPRWPSRCLVSGSTHGSSGSHAWEVSSARRRAYCAWRGSAGGNSLAKPPPRFRLDAWQCRLDARTLRGRLDACEQDSSSDAWAWASASRPRNETQRRWLWRRRRRQQAQRH